MKSGDYCSHLLAEPVYLSVVTCTTLVPMQVESIVWSQMLFDLSIAASLKKKNNNKKKKNDSVYEPN